MAYKESMNRSPGGWIAQKTGMPSLSVVSRKIGTEIASDAKSVVAISEGFQFKFGKLYQMLTCIDNNLFPRQNSFLQK